MKVLLRVSVELSSFNTCLPENHGIRDCKIVGSAGDGFGFFASLGSNKHACQEKALVTQDIDINIFFNSLELDPRNISPVLEETGFTWIYTTKQQVRIDKQRLTGCPAMTLRNWMKGDVLSTSEQFCRWQIWHFYSFLFKIVMLYTHIMLLTNQQIVPAIVTYINTF